MKKRLWRVLALCGLLAAALCVTAWADVVEYPVEGGSLWFDTETGTITSCDKTVTRADIPAEIDGVAVRRIGQWAFDQCQNLTGVTIPDSVEEIAVQAFLDCPGLTGVEIPGSVTDLGWGAFDICENLRRIDVSGDNPVYISVDGVVFNKEKTQLLMVPTGYAGRYTIPDGIVNIGMEAFSNCGKLTGVTIPDSVTEIESFAFYGCSALTGISIPASVTSIGQYVFSYCDPSRHSWIWKS